MTTDITQGAIVENKEEAPTITISLRELKCVSFELSEYAISNKNPIHPDNYEFQFSLNFSIHEQSKQSVVDFNIKIFEKKLDGVKLELATTYIYLRFQIINFDEAIKKDDILKVFKVPDNLVEICSGVSLSSARGMISVKLENTIYTNCILPLIDPKIWIQKSK